jgi:hypothetical protein
MQVVDDGIVVERDPLGVAALGKRDVLPAGEIPPVLEDGVMAASV